MKPMHLIVAIFVAAALTGSGAALAKKPESAGGGNASEDHGRGDHGKNNKHGKSSKGGQRDGGGHAGFGADERRAVNDYYAKHYGHGDCPPGLAKKNNGCLPPGQAKKWAVGEPLPRDVRYYDLPRELLRLLPPPPVNHRYVQVAGDILMIAVGTGMVVDAIDDLMR